MNVLFDKEKLLSLIVNLSTITGIRANVYDLSSRDLRLTNIGAPFCQLIQACPDGSRRCAECDRNAIASCGDCEDVYFYHCHAGISEAILPIRSNGHTLAYLLFGQFLDCSLREAFFSLRQYSQHEINAYVEILKTVKAYIDLSGMIQSTEYTDQQRLELHLDRHYMEALTLSSISRDLNIGRTKLCKLAKTLPGGQTLSQRITQRRIRAAKELLQNDLPISAVGEAVGINDYNYFSRVFRSVTGMTPSAFRKTRGAENDPN